MKLGKTLKLTGAAMSIIGGLTAVAGLLFVKDNNNEQVQGQGQEQNSNSEFESAEQNNDVEETIIIDDEDITVE